MSTCAERNTLCLMLLTRRSGNLDIRPSDVALVAVLLGMAYWNLWLDWDNYFPDSPPNLLVDSITSVVATTSLLFRRRAPLIVMAVTNLALFGPDLFIVTGPAYWGEWVPTLIAAYSVAVYRGSRYMGLPFATGLASYLVMRWRYPPEFVPPAAAVAWLAPVLVAVGAGYALRQLRNRTSVLTSELDAAEAAQVAGAERAVSEERARIARDLHDVIAHSVAIMVVQASAAENILDTDVEAARRSMLSVQNVGRKALEEMKLLLGVLQPADRVGNLDPAPTLRRLKSLIEPMREAGLTVDLDATGLERRIPPAVDVSSYRVIQEALTNALKHAPHADIFITVDVEPERVVLEVRNQTAGALVDGDSGYGLTGLRERVSLHGGVMDATRRPDGDFVLRVELPIKSEVHA
jgi:signal transduction histidine kinase